MLLFAAFTGTPTIHVVFCFSSYEVSVFSPKQCVGQIDRCGGNCRGDKDEDTDLYKENILLVFKEVMSWLDMCYPAVQAMQFLSLLRFSTSWDKMMPSEQTWRTRPCHFFQLEQVREASQVCILSNMLNLVTLSKNARYVQIGEQRVRQRKWKLRQETISSPWVCSLQTAKQLTRTACTSSAILF